MGLVAATQWTCQGGTASPLWTSYLWLLWFAGGCWLWGRVHNSAGRKQNGPQPQLPFVCMFTVPTALLCFDNLSSQNSRRKSYLAGLHKCMHTRTHTHTRADKAMDGWRKSQTTIRGAESGQRRTEGCNGCGPPQTGHQRKPRHGSEPRAAYQIWPQTSLRRWPPSLSPWAQRQLSMN